MPRANRSFIPGHVWHITHRCHQRQFLLKFVKDRACWCHWLFEAKKHYGLSVLNFVVTSNHISFTGMIRNIKIPRPIDRVYLKAQDSMHGKNDRKILKTGH